MLVMENDAILLNDGGRRFWLVGLGDQFAHALGRGQFQSVDDLPGMLKRITTDHPVILLVHEPDIFTQVSPRVTLTLAGHTHGGQIVVPFVPPLWTPSGYGALRLWPHRGAGPT